MRPDLLQTWKADFFKALAHPARIKILEHLRSGEKPAGEILGALGLEQSSATDSTKTGNEISGAYTLISGVASSSIRAPSRLD